jgi:hypothetical protein
MAVLVHELPPLAGLDADGVIGALGPALQYTLTG